MILACKGTCAPVAPPFKGQGGQCSRNAPPFRRPCLLYLRPAYAQRNGSRAVLQLIHHQCSIHCESSRLTRGAR